MYKGKLIISEDQGEVAILFCDICDFDKIVVEENARLIHFLDSLFRSFDQLCFNFKTQKIETVGKTYLACAGLKEYEYSNMIEQRNSTNSTTRILELAVEMMRHVQNYKWGTEGKELKLKIGINYGPVLAGVIGFHKPQFSLIGDTVNTTSRVCSTGDSGKIILSESAFKQLEMQRFQKNFDFIPKEVVAKGKGTIITYQVDIKTMPFPGSFFSTVISQASPKHSFFNSPKQKSRNINFSDAISCSNEEINKNVSFELSAIFNKTSDEIIHVSTGKVLVLRIVDNDVIPELPKNLNTSEKKTKQENSSKQPPKELEKIVIKPGDITIFNDDPKRVSYKKTSTFEFEAQPLDLELNIFESRSANNLPLDQPIEKMRQIDEIEDEVNIAIPIEPQTVFDRGFMINPLKKFKDTEIKHEKNFVLDENHLLNLKSSCNEIKIPSDPEKKKEKLFITLQINHEKPSAENGMIKIIDFERDDLNMMVENKIEQLKHITSSQTFPEEEIQEFYEFVEKKPQSSSQENNKSSTLKIMEDINLDYECLKDIEGDLFFLKLNKVFLTFKKGGNNLKNIFMEFLDKRGLKFDRFLLSFLTFYCISNTILNLILFDKSPYLTEFTLSKMALMSVIISLLFLEKKIKKSLLTYSIAGCFVLFIILVIVSFKYNLDNDCGFSEFIAMFIYCSLCQVNGLKFIEIIGLSLVYLLFDAIFVVFNAANFQKYFITLTLVLWQICNKHMKLTMELDLFNKERILEYEKKRLNELVQYLLPPHVKSSNLTIIY